MFAMERPHVRLLPQKKTSEVSSEGLVPVCVRFLFSARTAAVCPKGRNTMTQVKRKRITNTLGMPLQCLLEFDEEFQNIRPS